MILLVGLAGFVMGYLSVFVALATKEVISVRVCGVREPFRTERTFTNAFLKVFCHPYIKLSLSGDRKLVFGIKNYTPRKNSSNRRNNKSQKPIHTNKVSGKK